MVQISISVGFANVILWVLIDFFLLLLSITATRLIARYSVNTRLLSKLKVKLNTGKDVIDDVPYSGDLFLAGPRLRLMLTLFRIGIVCVSIYIGASLDGEQEISRHPFPVSSATFLSSEAGALTMNTGDDLNAMAKLSCLRVVNNNIVFLYKGYVSPEENILCEDGNATESVNILLKAEIRAASHTPATGLNISDMPMYDSSNETEPVLVDLKPTSLVVHAMTARGGVTDVSIRVVLTEILKRGRCRFGIWRSKGRQFIDPVDVKLEAPCNLRIAALDRLLRPKPEFLPPRMSFLLQIVDSVVVSRAEKVAPRVRDEKIVAALPRAAPIVLATAITFSAVLVAVFGLIVRHGKVHTDISSARGVGEVLRGASSEDVFFRWAEESGRIVIDYQYDIEAVDTKSTRTSSSAKTESKMDSEEE